ncbi:MAG: hypothetical protein MUF51_02885 [Vicinamibacteria bacterium]|jgi:hypothetical protein|nr:hypothetical protein [Vicinamibacteria bacterium]
MPASHADPSAPEPPPWGGSWAVWYGAVLLFLALLVGFFAWLTAHYQG